MISRLRGRLVSAYPDCIVDVGGVGFDVRIPEKNRERLGPGENEVEFFTYLYVREDRLVLYGFLDKLDRELFMRLISVSGIGPKLALGMLSDYPSERVIAAIKGRDADFLKTLPGLGKKTAERLSMELSEKLDDLDAAPVEVKTPSGLKEEVVLALTSLGMTKHSVEAALDKMKWSSDDGMKLEDVVREALKYASGI
jgi:holliday junction DNA helicase RuvA